MRLLYWAEQFHPYLGGIEVLTAGALPRLLEDGFECAVITSTGPLGLPETGRFGSIPVHRFRFRETLEGRDPRAIHLLSRQVGELEARLEPDLVHVFVSDPSCFFHLAARRVHRSRLVVSVHNLDSAVTVAGPSLLRRVLTEADWVIGNSSITLERLRAVAPACADRSSVVYSGVREPEVDPREATLDPVHLVCVGRLVEQKGIDLALDALARLRNDFSDARLHVIGDGPARPGLQLLAEKLGVADAVRFEGWVDPDRVYEHLDCASVVLIPSRGFESLSQVAIQASLMARPIVATRVGGLPEVVVDKQTGILVRPEDSSALAEAVARMVSSPRRAKEMAQAARRRALAMFTMSSYLASVAALYHRIGDG